MFDIFLFCFFQFSLPLYIEVSLRKEFESELHATETKLSNYS
jgi:hypothetical protein